MPNCDYCGKYIATKRGLMSHLKQSKGCKPQESNQSQEQVVLQIEPESEPEIKKEEQTDDLPKFEPLEEDTAEVLNKPTEEEFMSNWLDEYSTDSENKDITKEEAEKLIKEKSDSNSVKGIDQTFQISEEDYKRLFKLLNDIMDTLIVAMGGDETYSKMKDSTLSQLASSTKAYVDTLNFDISPRLMFVFTILVAYMPSTTSALNSVRTNRRLLKGTDLSPKEAKKLQKDVKIDPL